MSTYVIGDVHGQGEKLHTMLKGINFTEKDQAIFIGDVIDRGPNGWEILKMIKNTPNMSMIMGNHEDLMLRYCSAKFLTCDKKMMRSAWSCWEMNGGAPTFNAIMDDIVDESSIDEVLDTLMWVGHRPHDMDLEVNGRKFHVVHGFPMENEYDKLWERPTLQTKNPIPDCTLIIGHTPIYALHAKTNREIETFMNGVAEGGGHLHIEHAEGFIDIDCGAAYADIPGTRLAAIRLDDMSEFYV